MVVILDPSRVLLSAMMLAAPLPSVGFIGGFWLGKLSQHGLNLLGDRTSPFPSLGLGTLMGKMRGFH